MYFSKLLFLLYIYLPIRAIFSTICFYLSILFINNIINLYSIFQPFFLLNKIQKTYTWKNWFSATTTTKKNPSYLLNKEPLCIFLNGFAYLLKKQSPRGKFFYLKTLLNSQENTCTGGLQFNLLSILSSFSKTLIL